MKVIILAAGVGSRLSSITGDRPKCLVRAGGTPILQWQIDAYLSAGVKPEDVFVVAGYRVDQVAQFLTDHYPLVNLVENSKYDSTNNMYSLHLALKRCSNDCASSVIISNGDCVYDPSIITDLARTGSENCIVAEKGRYQDEAMKIVVHDGRIRDIAKTIRSEDAWGVSVDLYHLSGESTAGLLRIVEDYILNQKEVNLWTEVALKDLLSEVPITPFDIGKRHWVEIDNLDDLAEADLLFSDLDLSSKKCLVVDLDGTVYLGEKPIPGAVEFLSSSKNNKYETFFLTNNTSRTPKDYVARLSSYGIATNESHVLSPYISLVDHFQTNRLTRAFFVGNMLFSEYVTSQLPDLSLTSNRGECQTVVVAYDTELTYEKLKSAALLLKSTEVQYIATHCDQVCPTPDGPIPDAGSIVALLEAATGRTPDITFGKPDQSMIKPVLAKYKRDEIAIVGDRLYTDMLLANNAQVDFVLVLSGETNRVDVEMGSKFPTLILNDLGQLGVM